MQKVNIYTQNNPFKILTYPHPILSQKADKIYTIDDTILKIFDQMIRIMIKSGIEGLSAPQIGVPLCMIVVKRQNWIYKLINPHISWSAGTKTEYESCINFPDKKWLKERALEIVVEAIDESGQKQDILASDTQARIFQHHIDHLNGILINAKQPLIEATQLAHKPD